MTIALLYSLILEKINMLELKALDAHSPLRKDE